jgi:hypothetical protein
VKNLWEALWERRPITVTRGFLPGLHNSRAYHVRLYNR